MGLDHEQLTYSYAGRDFRLTDVGRNSSARDHGIEGRRTESQFEMWLRFWPLSCVDDFADHSTFFSG